MKYLIHFLFFITVIETLTTCNAQNKSYGILTGKLYDSKDNKPIIQATLMLIKDNIEIKKDKTNFNGKFELDSIPKGTYNLKILYVGFKPIEIQDIVIEPNKKSTLVLGYNQETPLKEVKVEWSGGHISFIDSSGNFRCVKTQKRK